MESETVIEKYIRKTGIHREDVTGKRPALLYCVLCDIFLKPSELLSHFSTNHFDLIFKPHKKIHDEPKQGSVES